jgi:hypothetical protein
MKKLTQLTVIFLLAGIVLSSCSSNLSITKRRYNKGYFVEHHHGKQKAQNSAVAQKTETRDVETKPAFAPQLLQEAIAEPAQTEAAQQGVVTAGAVKPTGGKAQKIKDAEAVPIELAVKNPVKTLRTASDLVKTAARSDDALSLLWVVIVVILILYLLGILFNGFGLGNLIHILAVIAVVLLILWLLRLI